MRRRLLYFIIVISLLPTITRAQITVVPSVAATVMANKLVGSGVTIMSPTLTCASNAYGTFAGISTLSFDSGIILTSGTAQTAGFTIGANGPAINFASTANGTPGDPLLTALAGLPTFDACILEFDFKPAGDTVKFNYVFGSEEYTSYACSPFNDVFGFFISGPGYGGPTNIALVPGTTIPVCINSVNCGGTGGYPTSTCNALGPGSPFCAYYVNNSAGLTITYDGLTKTLTAIAGVTPCDTYHLKIGIADGSDDVYDSGVFIEAGSLTSNGISVSPRGINPLDTGFGAQYCVRGCLPGKFIFVRDGSLADSMVIHFIIGGTGVNGYDYGAILDSVVIPPHDSTDTLFIYGLVVPPVGPKTVELKILAPYTCGGLPVIIDSAEITIFDSFYVHIITPDTSICVGQSVLISTTGDPSLSYTWTPSSTLNSSTVLSPIATPTVTTTYSVSAVYPGAGCKPSSTEMTITVYQPPVLNVGPPVQITCVNIPLQLGVTATPTGIPYIYAWSPITYLDNSTIANPVVTPGVAGDFEYTVIVSPPVPRCYTIDSFLLHVLPTDFSLFNRDTGVCFPPGTYQIYAAGDTEFSYKWTPPNGVSNPNIIDPTVSPTSSTTYTVTGSYPRCPNMVHTVLFSIEHPTVNIPTGDTTFCLGAHIQIPVIVTPADSPFVFTWSASEGLSDSTLLEPTFYVPTPGVYEYYITIKSSLGCLSTDSVIFRPQPPVRVAVTPGNTTIMYGGHLQLNTINLTPEAGSLFYLWVPDNGSLNNPNINDPIATPEVNTTYMVYGMSPHGCIDSASETITIDFTSQCIPNAFTPNGDGLNDVFRMCNMKYQKLVEFNIYNRWGELIFHNTTDAGIGWDGTFNGVPQDIGVYHYLIIIAQPDGTNLTYKGDVTLIR